MQKHYLADLIEPIVEDLGYETVRITTIGETNPTLQVMIEQKDPEKELTVDDCATVSRAISAVLDEKDPIENKYTLEVSSPGLDRPLTKLEHFKRFVGDTAKVETSDLIEKRKRFKGIIKEVTPEEEIIIEDGENTYKVPFSAITKAKIVLTDELWEKYLRSHKSSEA